MASTRELKGRISSVHSFQKITGAMKMISSARLRKSENALNNARPYMEQLQNILDHIAAQTCDYQSPLSQERTVQRVAVVIFAANEGLCGAFNLTQYKKLLETLNEYSTQVKSPIQVYPIGRKIVNEVKRTAGVETMEIPEFFEAKQYADGCTALADELIRRFMAKEIDRVDVIYSHYKSMGTQIVTRVQLLPWVPRETNVLSGKEQNTVYIYEPNCEEILETVYPLVIHSIMYRYLLENQTSEQASRILSMQMANDNAIKLLKGLQLEYNKLRQQNITAELMDIVGGSLE